MSTSHVRMASVVACLAIVTAGCAAASDAGADSEIDQSCPAELDWSGTTYAEVPHRGKLDRDQALPDARQTGCDDENGAAAGSVAAWSVAGVPTEQAFGAELGGRLVLYVAETEEDPCGLPVARC